LISILTASAQPSDGTHENYDVDRMGRMRIERLIACAPRELWRALINEEVFPARGG